LIEASSTSVHRRAPDVTERADLKMEGPPEIVEGIVMNVMTSCSLHREAPEATMPGSICELPGKCG